MTNHPDIKVDRVGDSLSVHCRWKGLRYQVDFDETTVQDYAAKHKITAADAAQTLIEANQASIRLWLQNWADFLR